MKSKSFLIKLIPAVFAVVIAIILSRGMNDYIMTLVNTSLIFFFCTAGLSLILGMGGQLSMCSITFMGLGAFLTAQCAKNFGMNCIASIVIGILLTTLVGFLMGLILMRLKGGFLVFGTIGLANIGATIFQNFVPLSGGPDGIYGIPTMVLFGYKFDTMQSWFFLLVAIAIAVILLISRIRATSLGRSLMAVRDDETAAFTLGVNVYRTKVIGFTISCALAALAGSLLAYHNGVVSSALFTFNTQIKFITMVMLGGINSTVGALVGTVLVTVLPELLRSLANYMNLIYGIVMIALMIFMPMGLVAVFENLHKKLFGVRRKKTTTNVR